MDTWTHKTRDGLRTPTHSHHAHTHTLSLSLAHSTCIDKYSDARGLESLFDAASCGWNSSTTKTFWIRYCVDAELQMQLQLRRTSKQATRMYQC